MNNIGCVTCHLDVNGDVVSLGDLAYPPHIFSRNQKTNINGKWIVEGDILGNNGEINQVNNLGSGIEANEFESNSASDALPKDLDGDGIRDFPTFNTFKAEGSVRVSQNSQNPITIIGNHTGDVTLIGTKDHPILLDGEVFIDGNLIIKGDYIGVGNNIHHVWIYLYTS